MAITGYVIDFLPVGEKSSSGDAILICYKEDGECKLILIDGGHKESDGVKTSDIILRHLRNHYFSAGTENNQMRIEHIICSHPDNDHVGGLQAIMEECNVGTFWINNPLDYTSKSNLAETTDNNAFSRADADTVASLIKVANEQGIAVKAPLEGKCIGPLTVASPSAEFYKALVKGELTRLGGAKASFQNKVKGGNETTPANWNEDVLFEFPATSVCNESSTVLFGTLTHDDRKVLLTADAGIEALYRAYVYLNGELGFQAGALCFMQMPHHGGRRNVNRTILDLLLGPKVARESNKGIGLSIASVASNADGYPKKAVTNAFTTRGYLCSATNGNSIFYRRGDMLNPYGGSPLTLIRFSNDVEALD